MNYLKEDALINVFEVSPTPGGGILILASENFEQLKNFFNVQKELQKATLLGAILIENVHPEILSTYLSQNTVEEITDLNFFEANSLCEGFLFAQNIVLAGSILVDFRVIRSVINRVVLVFTGGDHLQQNNLSTTTIKNPNIRVQQYFQILK